MIKVKLQPQYVYLNRRIYSVINTIYSAFLKMTLQSWELENQEGLAAFEFHMETDHCCFMTLPPGAAHFPKTTELRDIKYSHV
jgi:hypothetical protein